MVNFSSAQTLKIGLKTLYFVSIVLGDVRIFYRCIRSEKCTKHTLRSEYICGTQQSILHTILQGEGGAQAMFLGDIRLQATGSHPVHMAYIFRIPMHKQTILAVVWAETTRRVRGKPLSVQEGGGGEAKKCPLPHAPCVARTSPRA